MGKNKKENLSKDDLKFELIQLLKKHKIVTIENYDYFLDNGDDFVESTISLFKEFGFKIEK